MCAANTVTGKPALAFLRSPGFEQLAPIYVFAGEDAYLRWLCMGILRDFLLSEERPGSTASQFDDAADPRPIFAELRTIPFMGMDGYRLVTVTDGDGLINRAPKALREYAESPCRSSVLVLVCDSLPPKRPRGTKGGDSPAEIRDACAALARAACVVQCDPLRYERQAREWIGARAAAAGVRLAEDAVTALLSRAGTDSGTLDQEIGKLAIFAEGGRMLRACDVEPLVAASRMNQVYDLTDHVNMGETAKAIGVVENLMLAGESIQGIIAMMGGSFRKLWQAYRLRRAGASKEDAMRELRVPAYPAGKFLQQAARVRSEAQLARRLARLERADLESKTQAIHQQETERWIECLIIELCRLG